MRHRRTLFAAVVTLVGGVLTAACTKLGPNYSRPALDVPNAYKGATTQPATGPINGRWWTLFGDPVLTQLEEAALANNPDLAAAIARVAQARAVTREVASQFYPQVAVTPSITAGVRPSHAATTATRIPFDMDYEIDIWGQVARSVEAANANTQAAINQFAVVRLTLEADVAQNYMNLRSLEDQDRIVARNVELTRDQLALTQRKLQAGIVGRIDIAQAQTELDALISKQVDVRRQRADTEHALAILTGRAPAEFSVAEGGAALAPPAIPAELPAEILRHRPDVAVAEENLVAANAQVGVALANFYPTVRLTGLAGFESVDVKHALDWQSLVLSLAPSVSLPIFQGGRLTATLQEARTRYDELVAAYRSAVLGAFRDVEVSLTDVHMYADATEAQHRAVESAREYLRLSRLEYEQGIVSYLQLLDADRTLLTNEVTESQLVNQRLVSTVLLIKALGGGWNSAGEGAPETRP